jgi:hypothetical protein
MKVNYPLNLPASANLANANVLVSASFPQSCPFTKWGPTDCLDDKPGAESTANIKLAQ